MDECNHCLLMPIGVSCPDCRRHISPQPDPRLAHLPDDLRDIAEEFLGLHDAWGTEFEVDGRGSLLWINWGAYGKPMPFANLKVVTSEHGKFGNSSPWFCAWAARWASLDEAGESSGESLPLRRSADFAEFVQRFKAVADV